MEIVFGFGSLPQERASALAIGNFDGVHNGHQALLQALLARAEEGALVPAVMTFEPHPLVVLAPAIAPPRLIDLRAKASLLAGCGVKRLHVVRFSRAFASITAAEFLQRATDLCAAKIIAAGSDFRFGCKRRGNIDMLRAAAGPGKFELLTIADSKIDALRVSSKLVRSAVAAGEFERAAKLLSRPYEIAGSIVRGDRLGRALGMPTANLRFDHRPALDGIYAAWAFVDGVRERLAAALSVGTRPSLPESRMVIEAHLLNFSNDLYGRRLRLQPVSFIRPQREFGDMHELAEAMHADAKACAAKLSSAV